MEGWRDYQPTTWDAKKPPMRLWNKLRVRRESIPNYWTEYYTSCLSIYVRWQRFGLPFAAGWADHPRYIVRIIEVFDTIRNSHEAHEMKEAGKKKKG